MEGFLVGLAGIVIGSLVAAFGVRVFFLLLPLWGFVAGFVLGGDIVAALLGDGFLATTAGWAAGLGLGAVFAILAGLWFWAAILVLAAGVGLTIGAGVVAALGFEPGLLMLAAGIAAAGILVVIAIAINAPTLYVAVLTSFGGTALAVAGALVVLGRLGMEDLAGGPVGALRDYPLSFIAWLVLAVIALAYQLLEAGGRPAGLMSRLDQPLS